MEHPHGAGCVPRKAIPGRAPITTRPGACPLRWSCAPNAECQTHYGWGVGNTRITQIDHQFHRGYPGASVYDGRYYRATPPWPSDTDQFGVYYIRGPW